MSLWQSFKDTLSRWFLGKTAEEGGVKMTTTAATPAPKPAPKPKPAPEPETEPEPEVMPMPRKKQATSAPSEDAIALAGTVISGLTEILKTGVKALKDEKSSKSLPPASADDSTREPD